MREKFIIPLSLVLIIAAGVVIVVFPNVSRQSALALENVLEPSFSETLMNFDCSSLPCVILGPKQNQKGVELRHAKYEPSIISTKFNNISTLGIIANQGDIVILRIVSQDQPLYYLFIPAINISHTFSRDVNFPLFIDTKDLKGDYIIMLQDSLEPNKAATNFQAGILRVE